MRWKNLKIELISRYFFATVTSETFLGLFWQAKQGNANDDDNDDNPETQKMNFALKQILRYNLICAKREQ